MIYGAFLRCFYGVSTVVGADTGKRREHRRKKGEKNGKKVELWWSRTGGAGGKT